MPSGKSLLAEWLEPPTSKPELLHEHSVIGKWLARNFTILNPDCCLVPPSLVLLAGGHALSHLVWCFKGLLRLGNLIRCICWCYSWQWLFWNLGKDIDVIQPILRTPVYSADINRHVHIMVYCWYTISFDLLINGNTFEKIVASLVDGWWAIAMALHSVSVAWHHQQHLC